MTEATLLMGSFHDLGRTAEALDQLRALGISDRDITIVSSLPYSSKALGRPSIQTRLPIISLISALAGRLVCLFFAAVTPHLYVIRVGGQPVVPMPTTVVLLFEFTMLFLILGTFLGVVFLNNSPSTGPQVDAASLVGDRIEVLFRCPRDKWEAACTVLESQGAENVHQPERREL
jgi:hypothetical protein